MQRTYHPSEKFAATQVEPKDTACVSAPSYQWQRQQCLELAMRHPGIENLDAVQLAKDFYHYIYGADNGKA